MNPVGHQNLDALIASQVKEPRVMALPVWWRGYRFRSRAEGRWAVFFERMGIAYEYEPQGFKLENGTCYLPDFFLPFTRTWAEVKGFDATPTERAKCESIVMALGGTFLILAGAPDFRSYEGVSRDAGNITATQYSLDTFSHRCYDTERRFFSCPDEMTYDSVSPEYRRAVCAARSERFDAGELPQLGHEPFNPSEREMGGAE